MSQSLRLTLAKFTGEGLSNGEQVYMAASNNNDPNQWTTLNNGQPYLTSNVGTKGIRDPSLIVAPDRSKFWIIATVCLSSP